MLNAPYLRAPMVIVVALSACGDAPGADSVSAHVSQTGAPQTPVSAIAEATTTALPHASQRPALLIGTTAVRLDSTSMAEAGAALGMQAIVGDTAGHDPLMTACYTAGSGSDEVTVRIEAFGYVDPDATKREAMAAINVFKASIAQGADLRPPSRYVGRCVPILVPPSQVRWWNGLRVGMTRSKAERLLGPSKKTDEGDSIYEYDDRDLVVTHVDQATGKGRDASVYVRYYIRVRYDGDVATRIEVQYSQEHNFPGEAATAAAAPSSPAASVTTTSQPRVDGRLGLLIGALSVWLDSTSLDQAVDALGQTGMAGRREGDARVMNACYSSGSGNDRVRVVLTGVGPVENPPTPRGAMAMRVRRVSMARGIDPRIPSPTTTPCLPMAVRESEIRWSNGLQLGMARSEAERILGSARKTEDSRSVYSHLSKYDFFVGYESDVITRIEARDLASRNE